MAITRNQGERWRANGFRNLIAKGSSSAHTRSSSRYPQRENRAAAGILFSSRTEIGNKRFSARIYHCRFTDFCKDGCRNRYSLRYNENFVSADELESSWQKFASAQRTVKNKNAPFKAGCGCFDTKFVKKLMNRRGRVNADEANDEPAK